METPLPTIDSLMAEIRVGRQAIFDRNLEIYAYELLYRQVDGEETQQGDSASANTILNTFMEFGVNKIAGDKKVFINLTRRFFTELEPINLPKNRTVLEILEDIPVDDKLIEKVKFLLLILAHSLWGPDRCYTNCPKQSSGRTCIQMRHSWSVPLM